MLIEVLVDHYGLSHEEASKTSAAFLRKFRACPDNEDFELHDWPAHLWRSCLPLDFQHIANDLAIQWLELRFHYLALKQDVKDLLKGLREHYLLGLITNGPSRAQWQKVERLGLAKYFDCILVSGDLPWEKPDQNIFFEACKILNVEPGQCIMVGDKIETDIIGGKEAELAGTVWIPLTEADKTGDQTDLPDFTIDDVTELPELLPPSPTPKNKLRS